MAVKIKKPVVPYRVQWQCDCGGELEPLPYMLPSNPPQYPHVCKLCGKRENLSSQSGAIEYYD